MKHTRFTLAALTNTCHSSQEVMAQKCLLMHVNFKKRDLMLQEIDNWNEEVDVQMPTSKLRGVWTTEHYRKMFAPKGLMKRVADFFLMFLP